MFDVLLAVGICVFGYLSGSLPFALWITRWVKGIDVRDAGSGHASTTNTIRQAGWGPGILVLIFDIGKGYLPTLVALKQSPYIWAIPVVAALSVAGHCWPIFGQFRGGMGLATAGGCLIAIYPFGLAVGLMVLLSLTLLMKHSARASLITGLILAPIFYLFGASDLVLWLTAVSGFVLAFRFTIDWNRQYRELWLDRDLS